MKLVAREGAAEEELEMMKEGMVVEEGWERSHLLPPGWLIKSKAARAEKGKFSGSKAIHHSLAILTSEGITFVLSPQIQFTNINVGHSYSVVAEMVYLFTKLVN